MKGGHICSENLICLIVKSIVNPIYLPRSAVPSVSGVQCALPAAASRARHRGKL